MCALASPYERPQIKLPDPMGYVSDHAKVLEDDWRASRSGFYKGLILLASAYVHAGRGNAHGVGAQLRKTARELEPFAPFYLGQDVDALLALARRGPPLAAPPDLTPIAERFRGDEPELLSVEGPD